MSTDTICALATAPGGALGIIRISGENAISITSRIFSPIGSPKNPYKLATAPSHTLHFGRITDTEGNTIDEVLVSLFRTPHSYTGEDSVEISCHGSRYILNKVLELLIQHGCRQAHPGEFTQRAYLNGKLDLSQAEAVADLIASTNRATHQLAMAQLRGNFSSELSLLREQLLKLTSLLELELDFSDHEDLEFADRQELLELAQRISRRIATLAHSFETGQAIKQGIPVAIIGKTNAGKSTLLNRLLKDERAIVSDIHGTTRDAIEDTIDIQGITFRLIDTAGIRQTDDTIEQIGIQRTYQAIEKARIVIWLIDEWPSDAEISDLQALLKDKHLIIAFNKTDLPKIRERLGLNGDSQPNHYPSLPLTHHLVTISAKQGENIEALEEAIYAAADIPSLADTDVIVTNTRHYEALLHAQESITRVIDGLASQLSGDLLAEDLRLTIEQLAEITGGQITPQETLSSIFQHFCVGK